MNTLFFKKGFLITFILGLSLGWQPESRAGNVVLDGSTGTVGAVSPLLQGNTYQIDGMLYGTTAGSNLFFSFQYFNLANTDIANFFCTAICGSTTDVIARVTGGLSSIDGSITLSGALQNANFWLFNPNGVMFGNGASININGSLNISTASRLDFGGGQFLSANASDKNFLGTKPIGFNFSDADNAELDMNGVNLSSANGGINLSSKQVKLNGDNSFTSKADVNITADYDGAIGDISVNGGTNTFDVDGDVVLHATHNIEVTNGQIVAGNTGDFTVTAGNDLSVRQGGAIAAFNDGKFELNATNGNLTVDNASIFAGNNGDFTASAGKNLSVDHQGAIDINNSGKAEVKTTSPTGDISVKNGGTINFNNSGTASVSAGQDLTVGDATNPNDPDTAAINFNNTDGTDSNTNSASLSAGRDLTVQNGGTVDFNNTGTAKVSAGQNLTVANAGAITANSSVTDYTVTAGNELSVASQGAITANNSGDFKALAGGKLTVNNAAITANNTGNATIGAGKVLAGNGGIIDSDSTDDSLNVENGGSIDFNNTGTATATAKHDIKVDSAALNFNNTSSASLNAGQNLTVANAGAITAGNTGDFTVTAGNNLSVQQGGAIVAFNDGKFELSATKGNLTVDNASLFAGNNGGFTASAGNNLSVDHQGTIDINNNGNAEVKTTSTSGKISVKNGGTINFNNSGTASVSAAGDLAVGREPNDVQKPDDPDPDTAAINFNNTDGTDTNANSASLSAGRNLTVQNGGTVNFNNTGTATASAGRILTVANAGAITANNSGDFKALAGGDLIVNGGTITADNAGESVISAGSVIDNGKVVASASGGNLIVQDKGIIEKNTGSRQFIVQAMKGDKNTGKVIVKGAGSKIQAYHDGEFIINATGDDKVTNAASREQYAFQVYGGGQIVKGNHADMVVTARTVYLGGSAHFEAILGTEDNTGNMKFRSTDKDTVDDTDKKNYLFTMKNADIHNLSKNASGIIIKDYKVQMTGSGIQAESGLSNIDITSTTEANKRYVDKIIADTKEFGRDAFDNYIGTPGKIRTSVSVTNPIDALLVKQLGVLVAGNLGLPSLPENPCASQRGESTLDYRNTSGFLAEADAQMPYSIASAVDNKAAADFPATAAQPAPAATLDDKAGDCLSSLTY